MIFVYKLKDEFIEESPENHYNYEFYNTRTSNGIEVDNLSEIPLDVRIINDVFRLSPKYEITSNDLDARSSRFAYKFTRIHTFENEENVYQEMKDWLVNQRELFPEDFI